MYASYYQRSAAHHAQFLSPAALQHKYSILLEYFHQLRLNPRDIDESALSVLNKERKRIGYGYTLEYGDSKWHSKNDCASFPVNICGIGHGEDLSGADSDDQYCIGSRLERPLIEGEDKGMEEFTSNSFDRVGDKNLSGPTSFYDLGPIIHPNTRTNHLFLYLNRWDSSSGCTQSEKEETRGKIANQLMIKDVKQVSSLKSGNHIYYF